MTETMIDALKRGGYGNCRAMLLRYMRRIQREFCSLCSVGCPMTQHNLFDETCTALEKMDTETIQMILTVQVPQMRKAAKRIKKNAEGMITVFDAMAEIWGGSLEERSE